MDLIIHHRSCPDGFCAAFVAKKRFPEAEVLALDHGGFLPTGAVEGKHVLVVDFSWRTREDNILLSELAKSFRILDHHKTAQAVLEGLDFARFDMERSGAGLAWDYLFGIDSSELVHPNGLFIKHEPTWRTYPRPWYVDYVEDRDLWRHALPDSHEVYAFIMTLPFTFEAWSVLDEMSPTDALVKGSGAQSQVDHYVREAISKRNPAI